MFTGPRRTAVTDLVPFQISGQLPWRRVNDKAKVREMKEKMDYETLLARGRLPQSLQELRRHLSLLNYYSHPNYDGMIQCFQKDLRDLSVNEEDPLDWESPMQASELSLAFSAEAPNKQLNIDRHPTPLIGTPHQTIFERLR